MLQEINTISERILNLLETKNKIINVSKISDEIPVSYNLINLSLAHLIRRGDCKIICKDKKNFVILSEEYSPAELVASAK